jgi:hypothetical protein
MSTTIAGSRHRGGRSTEIRTDVKVAKCRRIHKLFGGGPASGDKVPRTATTHVPSGSIALDVRFAQLNLRSATWMAAEGRLSDRIRHGDAAGGVSGGIVR